MPIVFSCARGQTGTIVLQLCAHEILPGTVLEFGPELGIFVPVILCILCAASTPEFSYTFTNTKEAQSQKVMVLSIY